MALNDLLGLPTNYKNILIHPIKVKDYDLFTSYYSFLYMTKDVFEIKDEYLEKLEKVKLLDFIIMGVEDKESLITSMEIIFSLVCQKDVKFIVEGESYGFLVDNNNIINKENYDEIRNIIMKQNVLLQPKTFKNKLVQEWANKILESKSKNSIKISFEDKVNTIHVITGIPYSLLAEQTIYQIEFDFERILKLKSYESDVSFKCAGAESVNINHFAESFNLYESPYDKLFVNNNKLNTLNKAMSG